MVWQLLGSIVTGGGAVAGGAGLGALGGRTYYGDLADESTFTSNIFKRKTPIRKIDKLLRIH